MHTPGADSLRIGVKIEQGVAGLYDADAAGVLPDHVVAAGLGAWYPVSEFAKADLCRCFDPGPPGSNPDALGTLSARRCVMTQVKSSSRRLPRCSPALPGGPAAPRA